MTHNEMVNRAARWLRNHVKCYVVLTELHAYCSEVPDAIGWKYGYHSTLIECKVSRADFWKDQKKIARHPCGEVAIGARRFYMAPAGLLLPEEIPHPWGLLEVEGNRVRIIKAAVIAERTIAGMQYEMSLLVSALRRAQAGSVQSLFDGATA